MVTTVKSYRFNLYLNVKSPDRHIVDKEYSVNPKDKISSKLFN